MPEEIMGVSGDVIPSGCFRPGLDYVNSYTRIVEGLPISDGSVNGLVNSGNRKVYVNLNDGTTPAVGPIHTTTSQEIPDWLIGEIYQSEVPLQEITINTQWTKNTTSVDVGSGPVLSNLLNINTQLNSITYDLQIDASNAELYAPTNTTQVSITLTWSADRNIITVDASNLNQGSTFPTSVKLYRKQSWDASESWTVNFTPGTTIALDASYSATKDSDGTARIFSGSELIGAPAVGLVTTMPVEVKTNFTFNDTLWSKYIAYSLNYYGANPWQEGMVLDDDTITFGVGNATIQPLDESIALDAANTSLNILLGKYADGLITLDEYKTAFDISYSGLSARGKRACHSGLVTLRRDTGALHQKIASTHWDPWDTADVGGLNFYFGATPILGQPANKPYLVPYGPDADAVGPVKMNNGYFGTGTKGGLAIISKVASSPTVTALEPNDPTMSKGVATIVTPPDTHKYVIGYMGNLGAANYKVETDGERLFMNVSNYPNIPYLENQSSLVWTAESGEQFVVGRSYTTALDAKSG